SISYVLQKPSLMDEEMGNVENAVEDKTEAAADASSAFPIINHLFRPVDVGSRKLPILMVDRMADGSFLMQSELTYKYPEFDEILDQVCDMRNDPSSSRKERYMIVVDVNEVMQSKENFEETVYGFLLRPDSLEVFGKDEALIRFEAVLRAAAASEHYKYVESEEL
ncbi:MAG: hypothetical protein LUH00_07455, partial [Lachnospiraceae bacterium]|nr:hypothetical protein [Lachnospiraceae bacterium]